ncbi:hypothetical protein GTX14_18215 [Streptomyces sp. SID4944]|nr:hypothetical protein [Streptomyces sp. SID4944]
MLDTLHVTEPRSQVDEQGQYGLLGGFVGERSLAAEELLKVRKSNSIRSGLIRFSFWKPLAISLTASFVLARAVFASPIPLFIMAMPRLA